MDLKKANLHTSDHAGGTVGAAGSASFRRSGEDQGKDRVHFGGLVIVLLAIPCAGMRNRQGAAFMSWQVTSCYVGRVASTASCGCSYGVVLR